MKKICKTKAQNIKPIREYCGFVTSSIMQEISE